MTFIHKTAEVHPKAKVGKGTHIWHYVQILSDTRIGKNCTIGKGVYIDQNVKIGDKCNIQNNVSIYRGAVIEDHVFVGPHVCFSNNKNPRAVNERGEKVVEGKDWFVKKIHIKKGASIGANTTLVPGITIGEYALIGAGSIVTRDIPAFALAYGNPARVKGKVNKMGKTK